MDILFIGHSLIEFFDWQERFPAERVINLGVAGEMVRGLLSRIDSIVTDHPSADMIFLMTGLNDVAMEETGFIETYREVIERLKTAYPDTIIYIHSLLPTIVEFIDNETIKEVNDSIQKLALDTGVEYIDIYDLFIDSDGRPIREYLLDDGVHLSESGYAVWSGVIEGKINAYKQKL
jgi:lysophospholipase L1-like esterase